jgi:hypothetical protein
LSFFPNPEQKFSLRITATRRAEEGLNVVDPYVFVPATKLITCCAEISSMMLSEILIVQLRCAAKKISFPSNVGESSRTAFLTFDMGVEARHLRVTSLLRSVWGAPLVPLFCCREIGEKQAGLSPTSRQIRQAINSNLRQFGLLRVAVKLHKTGRRRRSSAVL